MGNCLRPSPSAAALASSPVEADAAAVETKRTHGNDEEKDPERGGLGGGEGEGQEEEEDVATTAASSSASPPASPLSPKADENRGGGEAAGGPDPDDGEDEEDDDDADPSTVERQREEGQRKLRELVISGAESGEIDWRGVVALAEDLHKKEQRLLRSYRARGLARNLWTTGGGGMGGRAGMGVGAGAEDDASAGSGIRGGVSRRQAFFERRRRKKEMARRKKLESVGSFSVNLLAYDVDGRFCHKETGPVPLDSRGDAIDGSDDSEEVQSQTSAGSGCSDTIDVYEDDDPSPLRSDPPYSRGCPASSRPSTPSPAGAVVVAAEGSFMAATSLFRYALDDESSSDSGSDGGSAYDEHASPGGGAEWDLMTIDEDATVTAW